MANLERDELEPNRYQYLDTEMSLLYDEVKESEEKDKKTIKMLLEKIAARSRQSHCNSIY